MNEMPIISRFQSENVLELVQYWVPPVPPWQPLKKTKNSSLRMACVVEDRLYHGLRFEGQVMLLTPFNWRQVLKYGKPDFLLMESIWSDATGHWHMSQCPNAPGRDELLEMVALAYRLSIPTVFWITKGHEYHEHYKDFARHFNYVFCADPKETELLCAEGIRSAVLLPCVQPAIYNPVRSFEHHDAFTINVLFDGWADIDKHPEAFFFMNDLNERHLLQIIETRFPITKNRFNSCLENKDVTLGCLSEKSRQTCLKYVNTYLACDKSISTTTEQKWRIFEAAACRTSILYLSENVIDKLLHNVVVSVQSIEDLQVQLDLYQSDALLREKNGHIGWRYVNENHTFSKILQIICKKISILHDWVEFPKVSIVAPTMRAERISNIIDCYETQAYANKELVIVYNSTKSLPEDIHNIFANRTDIIFQQLPEDCFAGDCLNVGINYSSGEFIFRNDDDDFYAEHYISDMILYQRSIDADFFGKPNTIFYFFDDTNSVHLKKSFPPLCYFSGNEKKIGNFISGNSFSGTRAFFSENYFPLKNYSAADTFLLYNLLYNNYTISTFDFFNIAAERRFDMKTHTWKLLSNDILRKTEKKYSHYKCVSI